MRPQQVHAGLAQLLGLLPRSDEGNDGEGRCIALCKEAVKDSAVNMVCMTVASAAVEVRWAEDAPEMPVLLENTLTGLKGAEEHR